MKTLVQLVKEAKEKLEIQEGSINKISTEKLEEYLKIAKKFLSEDAKNIITWLINHPNYTKELANGNAENALATFYNNGTPKVQEFKELYKWISNVVKSNRLLEIPVFQTKEQFDSILNKSVSPDEIIIDLSSEKGRNALAKKYDPLVWKIAREFNGKSEFSLEELHAIGAAGLVDAMNTYGKKTNKSEASDEQVKGFTFTSWASWRIRIWILENIKDQGHLVRIPRSVQAKERQETGRNTKSNSISVETPVGKDKDGNSKTLLDKIGDYERGGKSLEEVDNEKLWKAIHKKLQSKFDDKTLDVFYSWFGLNGAKKLSGKELMDKYGFKNQANITAIKNKVLAYMTHDKQMFNALKELYEFTNECRANNDLEDRDYEPVRFSGNRAGIFENYYDIY
jgi:DNA-directed RNA polymerase specialized sigma subunit